MRSYYEHLETALGIAKSPIPPHPTLRSSAIFPVINWPGITSRILFMGYWILKRNITQILAVVNLRSEKGELLSRQTFTISEPKAFRIELQDQLRNAGFEPDTTFVGSLEIEFFSTVNLVFPFPAVVVNYYGPQSSTVVHTAQRIYNDFDDMQRNSQTDVPESGFNIYADEEREPFIGLINGAAAVENCICSMEFYNSENQRISFELPIGKLRAYETRLLYPAREFNLKDFLKGKVGAGKVRFHVNWIFPRLLVGNIHHTLPAVTLTHTYYDTSGATQNSDYWRPTEPGWYPASLMVPAVILDSHFTNVYFYPIYSPSSFVLDLELYTSEGQLVVKKDKILEITAPFQELRSIPIKPLVKEMGIDIDQNLGARLIARNLGISRLPARIKIGLDVGIEPRHLPCNICTNLQPFNPPLESKPKSFRWGPVLTDQSDASLWIMNSAPHIHYDRTAEIEMTFHREQDAETRSRTFTLAPHGFRMLFPNEDPELRDFFQGQIGWFTATTTNPYTSTYYFAENASGVVGGDHGF